MPRAKVLRLEDYREKRTARVALARRFFGADHNLLAIFDHLTEVSSLCEADRVATVWIDEYGSGPVHPHVVLDQLADRPRRYFSSERLRRAWDVGVPGTIDELADPNTALPATFAVSLGSDGTRAWFIVAESGSGRPLLQAEVRERLLFLAGECGALLLHSELDERLTPEEESEGKGFAGWSILKDIEGRESDENAGRRIAQRFVVARVARMLADEGFVRAGERTAEQVRRARAELPAPPASDDREAHLWFQTLHALEKTDVPALADLLVEFGQVVEREDHAYGAVELYGCAYEAATAIARPEVAARAAWYRARVLRRRAAWDEARHWYLVAQGIADAAGLAEIQVHVLVGLALIKRDLGNIPEARRELGAALPVAGACGVPDLLALVHHSLLGVEQIAGNVAGGLQHGWVAVSMYQDEERRTQCTASLAAALMEYGDLEAAEDAWSLVAQGSAESHYLTYAYDALAHISALRGDREGFRRHALRCDEMKWEEGARSVKAEILQYRGLSYRALGDLEVARSWLQRAVDYAGKYGFNRVLFEAEAALDSLAAASSVSVQHSGPPAATREVREGLRSMRQALVTAGA